MAARRGRRDAQGTRVEDRRRTRLGEQLGLPFEDNLQRWLLDHPDIIKFLNHYYVLMHFPVATSNPSPKYSLGRPMRSPARLSPRVSQ